MERISITEKIDAIIERNLEEKHLEEIVELDSCKDCWYHEDPWIRGRPLHICGKDGDEPRTSRDMEELFNSCPINGKLKTRKNLIKQYGIITSDNDDWCRDRFVAIVDFSPSRWEWDGNNPDIDYRIVAQFFYEDEEDKEKMEAMALDYFEKFGFDEEWTKKICYG